MPKAEFANPFHFTLDSLLEILQLDALWLSSLPAIQHQCGFTGSAGNMLLARDGRRVLFVDGRYTEQAGLQCGDHARVVTITHPYNDMADEWMKMDLHRIGFESLAVTIFEHQMLLERLEDVELVPVENNMACLRSVKNEDELAILRKGNELAGQVFESVVANAWKGMTEKDLAWELEKGFRQAGGSKLSFDTIVAAGERGALIHGFPSDRKLQDGDLVVIDRGMHYEHFATDETNTLVVGKPTEKQKEIYQVVKDAHDYALDVIKPGASLPRLDEVARGHIESKGYGEYFTHRLGHGVGLEVHEQPVLSPAFPGVIVPGMVFSVEPGIYISGWGGIRIEDVVVATEDGYELLTRTDKSDLRSFPI